MSEKVNREPIIAKPNFMASDVVRWATGLVFSIMEELRRHANRLNATVTVDGVDAMTGPLILSHYTKTTMPTAASWQYGLIYVTNETGGQVPAFSDGTNWRRVTDRAIVS